MFRKRILIYMYYNNVGCSYATLGRLCSLCIFYLFPSFFLVPLPVSAGTQRISQFQKLGDISRGVIQALFSGMWVDVSRAVTLGVYQFQGEVQSDCRRFA